MFTSSTGAHFDESAPAVMEMLVASNVARDARGLTAMHRRREEIRESIFGTTTVEKSIVVGIGIVLYVVDLIKSRWGPKSALSRRRVRQDGAAWGPRAPRPGAVSA
jgi:hypothetical protein